MATMGEKSFCPIVSLLTKYADFSSCYITPNRRNRLYNPQEWAVEALLEYLATRLSKVILPARQPTNDTIDTRTISEIITKTTRRKNISNICENKYNTEEEEERGGDKVNTYRQPVYLYIELQELSDREFRRKTILEKNVLFRPRNYDREDSIKMHIKEETQDSPLLENIIVYGQVKKQKHQKKQLTETFVANFKKVRFNLKPEVHIMYTWSFAYKAARKGEWHFYAVDRSRFQMRVYRAALYLNPILTPEHRNKIYTSRFAE